MSLAGTGSGTELLAGFDRARLDELLARFQLLRVAVIGDFFLDKYLEVDPRLAEPSLETGKTAHQVVGTRHAPGAAGTVVNNLATLMALPPTGLHAGHPVRFPPDSQDTGGGPGSITAVGFTGDDGAGYELRADLRSIGVGLEHLHSDTDLGRRTPVYLKPKDLDLPGLEGEHSRYDLKNRVPTGKGMEHRIMDSMSQLIDGVDALVAMDQVEDEGLGVFTSGMYDFLSRLVDRRKQPVCWADSRRRIARFSGFVRKMNQFELLDMRDPEPGAVLPDGTVSAAFRALDGPAGSRTFVTAGERGVWVRIGEEYRAAGDGSGGEDVVFVPAVRVEGPVDPTGAGDSFTAGAVLALASGASSLEAALVGTLAASVTVRKLGMTGTASPHEMRAALALWKEQRI
jgi:sugar/nucleoside kinase (ribokinase family)